MTTAHVTPSNEPGGFAILQVMQWDEDGLLLGEEKARRPVRPIRLRPSVPWKR